MIRKEVSDPPNADQTFTFEGNISYTPDGAFPLTVTNGKPASATFFRAADGPGRRRRGRCASSCRPAGGSPACRAPPSGSDGHRPTRRTPRSSIRLLAGDTVTCTFTDALRPPPGQLLLSKVTLRRRRDVPVPRPRRRRRRPSLRASATTTEPGVAVAAEPGPFDARPGRLPSGRAPARRPRRPLASDRGQLQRPAAPPRAHAADRRSTITAGGGRGLPVREPLRPVRVDRDRQGHARRHRHDGVRRSRRSPIPRASTSRRAATTAAATPALARGDSTRRLRARPLRDPGDRHGLRARTVAGRCSRSSAAAGCARSSRARSTSSSPREQPHAAVPLRQRVHPRRAAAARTPSPPTPAARAPPPAARPDLVVTKRALQRRVRLGAIARFEITVRNAGAAAAEQVVVADAPGRATRQLVSGARQPGRLRRAHPLICRHRRAGAGRAGHDPRARPRRRHAARSATSPSPAPPRRSSARQQRRPRARARAPAAAAGAASAHRRASRAPPADPRRRAAGQQLSMPVSSPHARSGAAVSPGGRRSSRCTSATSETSDRRGPEVNLELLVQTSSGSTIDNVAAVATASSDRTVAQQHLSYSRVRKRNLVCVPGVGLRPRRDASRLLLRRAATIVWLPRRGSSVGRAHD